MLKRIKSEHLRPGMYLQELCGSWMTHPFWRESFLLKEQKDIRRILESGIEEVWIDTDKGGDVDTGQSREEVDEQVAREMDEVAASADNVSERIGFTEELERAARICQRSKEAVVSMFQQARMGKAVEADSAMQLVDDINSSVQRNPGALISLARLKRADDYTYMHSVAVCGLMIAVSQQLGLEERQVRDAGLAGLLHDVGKMAIPLSILNKPGKLDDDEFELIKSHPLEGRRMLLEGRNIPQAALDACLHHHEKIDGKGYPDRLQRAGISQFARMCAICDVYDAVTSDRPYKKGWDPAEALRKMAEWSNSHFDNEIFFAFVKSVGIYPAGTLVRLESGRLGVVVDRSGHSLLTPKIKLVYSTKAQVRLRPEILDLARPGCNDKIAAHEAPEKWNFPDLEELWRGAGPRPW